MFLPQPPRIALLHNSTISPIASPHRNGGVQVSIPAPTMSPEFVVQLVALVLGMPAIVYGLLQLWHALCAQATWRAGFEPRVQQPDSGHDTTIIPHGPPAQLSQARPYSAAADMVALQELRGDRREDSSRDDTSDGIPCVTMKQQGCVTDASSAIPGRRVDGHAQIQQHGNLPASAAAAATPAMSTRSSSPAAPQSAPHRVMDPESGIIVSQ